MQNLKKDEFLKGNGMAQTAISLTFGNRKAANARTEMLNQLKSRHMQKKSKNITLEDIKKTINVTDLGPTESKGTKKP